jgi:predicted glutamine amidotransferase
MCRFATYFGQEAVLLDELLAAPKNSLIKQSHESREGTHSIHADGFGVAWYNLDISKEPGIFKSTQPAWNDNNLMHISQKIKSSCFLAHVRAATVGDVNQNNCHPFAYKSYSMVHNGTIRHFDKYKKQLINMIDEKLFLELKGNTDSEHFFFLIMHFLSQKKSLIEAVRNAINWVSTLQENYLGFSRINIVITNGHELLATRFVSKGEDSLSLKYCTQDKNNHKISSLILSSESLNDDELSWNELPEQHYIYINKEKMQCMIEPL